DFCEVPSARIANQLRNLLDAHIRIGQQLFCPQQSKLCQILYERDAILFMEESAQIVRGYLQPLCDLGNANVRLIILLDELDYLCKHIPLIPFRLSKKPLVATSLQDSLPFITILLGSDLAGKCMREKLCHTFLCAKVYGALIRKRAGQMIDGLHVRNIHL